MPFKALLIALLVLPCSALAVDGVREISHTCASETGCFAGDAAGYPVLITTAGSYRLTSNLSIADVDTHGIHIQVDGVTIDLNGFEIRGPVSCSIDCSAGGTGIGIYADGKNNTRVHNGIVRGMGDVGVTVSFGSIVQNVQATENAGRGIATSLGSVVENCTSRKNGTVGFVGDDTTFRGNSAVSNGDHGFQASNSTFNTNTASQNGGHGIAATGSTVIGNTVTQNENGINCGPTCLVRDNLARVNALEGIRVGGNGLVMGNVSSNNTGFGMKLGADTVFRENLLVDNGGHVKRSFNGANVIDLGSNICDGGFVCTISD